MRVFVAALVMLVACDARGPSAEPGPGERQASAGDWSTVSRRAADMLTVGPHAQLLVVADTTAAARADGQEDVPVSARAALVAWHEAKGSLPPWPPSTSPPVGPGRLDVLAAVGTLADAPVLPERAAVDYFAVRLRQSGVEFIDVVAGWMIAERLRAAGHPTTAPTVREFERAYAVWASDVRELLHLPEGPPDRELTAMRPELLAWVVVLALEAPDSREVLARRWDELAKRLSAPARVFLRVVADQARMGEFVEMHRAAVRSR